MLYGFNQKKSLTFYVKDFAFAVWTGLLSRRRSKAAWGVAMQINRPSPTALAGTFLVPTLKK